MRYHPFIKLAVAVLGAVVFLAGCNIFNPSGEGDAGTDASGNTSHGEELFRQKDFAGAMSAFEKAIGEDSANSMAYYGYAKAAVRYYKLNVNGILKDLDSTKNGGSLTFLNHDDNALTKRLQAAVKVNRVLGLLTDRDTLTRRFNKYLKGNDSADFMRKYLDSANMGKPGFRKRSRFPLIDFIMPYDKVVVDFTAFEVLYNVTRLYDLDQNDIIDSRDALMKKIHFGKGDGGFSVDSLSSIRADLQNDPVARDNLNSLIQNVSGGLASASQLAALIGGGKSGGSDTGKDSSLSGSSGNDVTKVINDLGDAITFYQFGDSRDNDGDGCVDEEIMDGKDNDGDGFVDEDARVVPVGLGDFIDNDHNSVMDDAGEEPDTSTAPDTVSMTRNIPAHDSTFQVSIPAHDSTYYYQVFAHDSSYDSIAVPSHDTVFSYDVPAHDSIDYSKDPPDTLHISQQTVFYPGRTTPVCFVDTTVQPQQCLRITLHIPDHLDSGTIHVNPQFCVNDTSYHPPRCRMDTVHISAHTIIYDTVYMSGQPGVLGFVKNFEKQNQVSFIKIRKSDDSQMPIRIRIQKDSLLVKMAGKSYSQLSSNVKNGLDSAVTFIGGCWRNYVPESSLPKKSRWSKP